jgi:hypothetical protein
MIRPKHIILRLLQVAIPVLLAMAPAMAQTDNLFVGQTVELSVEEIPGTMYTWELYNNVATVNFATDPGNCPQTEAVFTGGISTGAVVHITLLNTGTYFYKVTAQSIGCTNNLKVGKITVIHPLPTGNLSLSLPTVCTGQSPGLEASFTGTAPFNITCRITKPDGTTQDIIINNIIDHSSKIPFIPSSSGTYTFEILRVTDAYTTNTTPTNTVTVTVNAKPDGSRIYKYDPVTKKK